MVGLEGLGEKWSVHLASRNNKKRKEQAWAEAHLRVSERMKVEKVDPVEAGGEEEVKGNNLKEMKVQVYRLQRTGMKSLMKLKKEQSPQKVINQEDEESLLREEDSRAHDPLQKEEG